MEFEIQPYQTLGTIPFGCTRFESRSHFSIEPTTELMSDGSFPNDTYESLGVYVIFDKYNRFSAAEINAPSSVIFNGDDLLKMTWNQLLSWFQSKDKDLVISEKDVISYKLGISAFAPNKNENPDTFPESITVFRKDFFNQKIGIPDPELLDSFFIQVAFVEGIEHAAENFDTVSQALQQAFSNNRESGILLWNRIPVAFNYNFDLPVLLNEIVRMLHQIQTQKEGTEMYALKCASFETEWTVKWNEKYVLISSEWTQVSGSYSGALNQRNEITALRSEFLAEWKQLLKQCHQTLKISGASISEQEEQQFLRKVKSVEKTIANHGKFYTKQNDAILVQHANGRKEFNLAASPWYVRWGVSIAIIFGVFLFAWYINREKGNPFWMLEALIPTLAYTFAIAIPTVALTFWYYRYKNRKKK